MKVKKLEWIISCVQKFYREILWSHNSQCTIRKISEVTYYWNHSHLSPKFFQYSIIGKKGKSDHLWQDVCQAVWQDMLINISILSSSLYKMDIIVVSILQYLGKLWVMHIKTSELIPDIVKTQELLALSFIIIIFLSHKKKHSEMALIFNPWRSGAEN